MRIQQFVQNHLAVFSSQPFPHYSHEMVGRKPMLRWSVSWCIRVMVSYMFAHTLSILGPLCTKYTLKRPTIFAMHITCMHLHVMISSECLVTHSAWKWPNFSCQCSPPPCNNTSIITVSPSANTYSIYSVGLCNSIIYIRAMLYWYKQEQLLHSLLSKLHTHEQCWSTYKTSFPL